MNFSFFISHLSIKHHLSFTKLVSGKWDLVNNLANSNWLMVNTIERCS